MKMLQPAGPAKVSNHRSPLSSQFTTGKECLPTKKLPTIRPVCVSMALSQAAIAITAASHQLPNVMNHLSNPKCKMGQSFEVGFHNTTTHISNPSDTYLNLFHLTALHSTLLHSSVSHSFPHHVPHLHRDAKDRTHHAGRCGQLHTMYVMSILLCSSLRLAVSLPVPSPATQQ